VSCTVVTDAAEVVSAAFLDKIALALLPLVVAYLFPLPGQAHRRSYSSARGLWPLLASIDY
jgi:hypothetical protein